MNNKSNGSGCLTAILGFVAFAGNILLLSGDLDGNLIEIITVIIAIIADIAVVGYIIAVCIEILKEHQEEKEKLRIIELTLKVDELVARYSPSKVALLQKTQEIKI